VKRPTTPRHIGRPYCRSPSERSAISPRSEQSIFKFGGSAVVLFSKKDARRPAKDILEQTRKDYETHLRLGEIVARRGNERDGHA